MTTISEMGAPDAGLHRKEADYARLVLGQLKAAGMSEREVAQRVGLSDRVLRAYKTGEQAMSYAVQFALEALCSQVSGHQVQEAAAPYGTPRDSATIWHLVKDRPISKLDVGKIVVGKDRFGAGVCGSLVADGFGLVIREIHPQPVDVHSVPVDRVYVYTLLDPPNV